jgi:two-component system, LytTR family, sensor kinase
MERKNKIYWYCQIIGWSVYIFLNLIFFGLTGKSTARESVLLLTFLPMGIFYTHLYRNIIIRYRFLKLKVIGQVIIVILSSVALAIIFILTSYAIAFIIGSKVTFNIVDFFANVFSVVVVFVMWNIFYFVFHYFQNYKRSEINNYRLMALSNETELNNLKAQLNPHFMFNSLNSIRALIDEEPPKAKKAITQLSNILRNTLLMSKNKEITLKDELVLVKDYLELEQIRYEERLTAIFSKDENCEGILVPPLIVQAQVENGIKHGISRLPEGGKIEIEVYKDQQFLHIHVSNSGQLNTAKPETGFGFKNSEQRLQILYGDTAKITIHEEQMMVHVKIQIPLQRTDKLVF